MLFCIAVDDKNYGVGKDGKLNWAVNVPEDLQFFKETTTGKNIVVGHNTFKHLPKLKNRYVMCLSKNTYKNKPQNFYTEEELEKAIFNMENKVENGKDSVVICGGKSVYELMLNDKTIRQHLTHGFISYIEFKNLKNQSDDYDVYVNDFVDAVKQQSVSEEVVLEKETDDYKLVIVKYCF